MTDRIQNAPVASPTPSGSLNTLLAKLNDDITALQTTYLQQGEVGTPIANLVQEMKAVMAAASTQPAATGYSGAAVAGAGLGGGALGFLAGIFLGRKR